MIKIYMSKLVEADTIMKKFFECSLWQEKSQNDFRSTRDSGWDIGNFLRTNVMM